MTGCIVGLIIFPVQAQNSKTETHIKTRIGVDVTQGMSGWHANFELCKGRGQG